MTYIILVGYGEEGSNSAANLPEFVELHEATGHRVYAWEHVGWAEFIKRLRATGMPIRDIQRSAHLLRQGEQTVVDRMHLLKEHRGRVQAHLLEIEHHLAAITEKIAYYEERLDAQPPSVSGGGNLTPPHQG